MGPKTPDNTGGEFQELVNQMFELPRPSEQEKEDDAAGDKSGEDE